MHIHYLKFFLLYCLIFVSVFLSPQYVNANDPMQDFLVAMRDNDNYEMKSIVRYNKQEMGAIFFMLLNHAALKIEEDDNSIKEASTYLLVAAQIAEAFSDTFILDDFLYNQVKDNKADFPYMLQGIYSDKTLSRQIREWSSDLQKSYILYYEKKEIAENLISLYVAASETPQERRLRILREEEKRQIEEKAALRRIKEKQIEREVQDIEARIELLKQNRNIPELLALLDNSSKIYEQKLLIKALGQLGDPAAVKAISCYLNVDGCDFVAINALEMIGGDHAVKILVDTQNKWAGSYKVGKVTEALDRIWKQEFAELHPKQGVADAIRILSKPSVVLRQRMIAAIKYLGNSGEPAALEWLLQHVEDPNLAVTIIHALAKYEDVRVLELLLQKCDATGSIGSAAKDALKTQWNKMSSWLDIVNKSGAVSDPAMVIAVAKSALGNKLSSLYNETSEELLVKLLGKPAALEWLLQHVEDPNRAVTIIRALAKYEDVRVLELLLQKCGTTDPIGSAAKNALFTQWGKMLSWLDIINKQGVVNDPAMVIAVAKSALGNKSSRSYNRISKELLVKLLGKTLTGKAEAYYIIYPKLFMSLIVVLCLIFIRVIFYICRRLMPIWSHYSIKYTLWKAKQHNNQDKLKQITLDYKVKLEFRLDAVHSITRQEYLTDICLGGYYFEPIMIEAFNKIETPAELEKLCLNSKDNEIKMKAFLKITNPDDNLLAKLIETDSYAPLRLEAVERANDEEVLVKAAISDSDKDVAMSAVKRLHNRLLLARVAKSSGFKDVCFKALESIDG